MPCKSKAEFRRMVDPGQWEVPYELRVFERPDGMYSIVFYANDEVPDAGKILSLQVMDAENAELVVKLITGENCNL